MRKLVVIFLLVPMLLPAIEKDLLIELTEILTEYEKATSEIETGLQKLQEGLEKSQAAQADSEKQINDLELSLNDYRKQTDKQIRKIQAENVLLKIVIVVISGLALYAAVK